MEAATTFSEALTMTGLMVGSVGAAVALAHGMLKGIVTMLHPAMQSSEVRLSGSARTDAS